jgi:hypothetical protein
LRLANTEEETANLQAQKEAHLGMFKKFTLMKQKYSNAAKKGSISMLTFDYMQNLVIPNLQTNDVYYRTQVRIYVFGVHNVQKNSATMYVYDEQNGCKGADNVCSLLFHYFCRLPYKPLVLICDNCPGQNKNKTLVRFLYIVVHVWKIVPSVVVLFPICGHSYLYNDGDFAQIDKKKPCETPTDWIQEIQVSRMNPTPFEVVHVDFSMFYNMTELLKESFFKEPKPSFAIKSARMVKIDNDSPYVSIRYGYSSRWGTIQVLNDRRLNTEVELRPLYSTECKLNDTVKANMKHLFQFTINPSSREYYEPFLRFQKLPACRGRKPNTLPSASTTPTRGARSSITLPVRGCSTRGGRGRGRARGGKVNVLASRTAGRLKKAEPADSCSSGDSDFSDYDVFEHIIEIDNNDDSSGAE